MLIQIFHDRLSCIEAKTLQRCLYVNYNWKQSSYLTNTLLLQNQCYLLLPSHNRLPLPPPVIYVQSRLKMIKYETIVTLQETVMVMLTMHVTRCIDYPEPVGSCMQLFTISKVVMVISLLRS